MPYDDPDPTDPMTLHGIIVPTDDAEVDREMATTFIEEYMRMGYGRDRILSMFKIPDYVGPSRAYRSLGEEALTQLIDDVAAIWGGRRETGIVGRDENGSVRAV